MEEFQEIFACIAKVKKKKNSKKNENCQEDAGMIKVLL